MSSSIPQTGIAALIHANNNKPAPPAGSTTSIFGEDGFTFGDIIDIVNPLQHIPIVSNIYRKITGDTIAPAMEIAGGALFGGPLGAAISMVTTAFRSHAENKTESTDPDSPYMDKESTAIASNTEPQLPHAINNNDYSKEAETGINHTSLNNPVLNRNNNWILNSESFTRGTNSHASLNPLKDKHVYQPADGVVNMAYKSTETYTDVITSTELPEKSIDIVIGATSDAG